MIQNSTKEKKSSNTKAKTSGTKATKPTNSTASKNPKTSKPQPKAPSLSKEELIRLKNERKEKIRVVLAFLVMAASLILYISTSSYFSSWREDQSLATMEQMQNFNPSAAHNNGGKLGVAIGSIFVGEWFGIFSLAIPTIIFLLALRLFKIKIPFLLKASVSLIMIMLIASAATPILFPQYNGLFGSSAGGAWGYFTSQWLINLFGIEGSYVIVFTALALWLTYTSLAVVKYMGKSIKMVYALLLALFAIISKWITSTPKKKSTKRRIVSTEPNIEDGQQSPIYEIDGEEERVPEQTSEESDEEVKPSPLFSDDDYSPEEFVINPIMSSSLRSEESVSDDDFTLSETHATENGEIEELNTEDMVIMEDIDFEDEVQLSDEGDNITPTTLIESPTTDSDTPAAPVTVNENEETEFEINRTYTSSDEMSDKFEIAVTSNAQIAHDVVSDEVILSTNEREEADEVDMTVYDPTKELSSFMLPPVDMLENRVNKVIVSEEELVENKNRIVETLKNFNIAINKIKATIGPTVTLYEIIPAAGVRISKIKNLEDDIALSLSALGIRIIAPIPGKGTIGIEVPNKNKEVVSMYSVVKSAKFQETKFDLPIVLGRTIQNDDFVIDLAKMPHLLVAGATGQGKSVGLNAIITSLLYKKHPAELKFVLVDPKKVELTLYSAIERHYLAKMESEEEAIITETDKVVNTLNSLCIEMDARYLLLKNAKVRNIKEYNAKFTSRRLNPNNGHRYLPYFVVIIDEFADLIMTAGREVETPIARIAQLARAVGIHLIIATQRPTTNIITGVIKANFPARIAFKVTSMIDSRTILDSPGANQLIGQGDMLVSTGSEMIRVQCAFVDTPEVERITEYIGSQRGYGGAYELPEYVPESNSKSDDNSGAMVKLDSKFTEVARYVVQNQQGSASTIQRNFEIGFNRAGRIMDQLERAGIVSKQQGSKPRQVLISDMATLEVRLYDMENNITNVM